MSRLHPSFSPSRVVFLSRHFLLADDKATIGFVAWGGLGAAKDETYEADDGSSAAAASAAAGREFDIAAEIDALPAQQQTDAETPEPEADVTM